MTRHAGSPVRISFAHGRGLKMSPKGSRRRNGLMKRCGKGELGVNPTQMCLSCLSVSEDKRCLFDDHIIQLFQAN